MICGQAGLAPGSRFAFSFLSITVQRCLCSTVGGERNEVISPLVGVGKGNWIDHRLRDRGVSITCDLGPNAVHGRFMQSELASLRMHYR